MGEWVGVRGSNKMKRQVNTTRAKLAIDHENAKYYGLTLEQMMEHNRLMTAPFGTWPPSLQQHHIKRIVLGNAHLGHCVATWLKTQSPALTSPDKETA
jgi:hypothetical protein